MPFPYLGNSTRVYVQFRDLEADTPLTANPGQSYDMAPVAGWDLPVPPGDGWWGPPVEPVVDLAEESEAPAVEPEPAPEPEPAVPDLPPVPLTTAETEES